MTTVGVAHFRQSAEKDHQYEVPSFPGEENTSQF